ncbi:MAG: hypothetical protein WC889_17670 [Myxococcota bacterium]|jgi:hypothetical protein
MEEVIIKIPEGKALIRDGRCPKGCSLMNPLKLLSGKPVITCEIKIHGMRGYIHLNPYYGIFEHETEVQLMPGDHLDLFCPKCGAELSVSETCAFCRVNLFGIHLPNGGEVRACPVVGCHNHKLILVDLDAQLEEYYNNEMKPKM